MWYFVLFVQNSSLFILTISFFIKLSLKTFVSVLQNFQSPLFLIIHINFDHELYF